MRILISDYSGHPFQVQLARELARRGCIVRHTFSAGFQTPKGNLVKGPDDPADFEICPVRNTRPFAKTSFVQRRRQEIEIGHALAAQVKDFRPDAVISSNAPLDTQQVFQTAAREAGAQFVFWLQDIYSEAISRVVPKKIPVAGHGIAAWYRHLEFSMLRKSDHVVAITEDFVPALAARGIDKQRVSVIENWAPLNELPQHPRNNAWTMANMPGEALRIVYSGTLGYKHNPALLAALARRLPKAQVYVYSEGEVADALKADAAREGLHNLSVHPWVPFAELPLMLSGADIFVAVIEPDAGLYSVPSKILTYLAIGRPILACVPEENLAARLICQNDAGFVLQPGDDQGLVEKAALLCADAALRRRLGGNARAYAERAFDVGAIADQFITILQRGKASSQAIRESS